MSIIRPTHLPEDCEPTAAEIAQIQRDRLAAVRRELKKRDLTAAVLFDPTHMRYATGSRNMQVYSMRNPARYVFVPAEGKVVLFEYAGCDFLAEGLDTVDEVRPATAISYYFCDDMERDAFVKAPKKYLSKQPSAGIASAAKSSP